MRVERSWVHPIGLSWTSSTVIDERLAPTEEDVMLKMHTHVLRSLGFSLLVGSFH